MHYEIKHICYSCAVFSILLGCADTINSVAELDTEQSNDNDGSSKGSDIVADTETVLESEDTSESDTWAGPGSGRCDQGQEAMQLKFGDPSDTWGSETLVSSGVEICPDYSAHRYESVSCISEYKPFLFLCDTCNGGAGCSAGKTCISYQSNCSCYKLCMSDDDCDLGEACLCGLVGPQNISYSPYGFRNSIPRCLPANCRTDADCGGYRCGISQDGCGQITGLRCHTKESMCEGASQCPSSRSGSWFFPSNCEYSSSNKVWECGLYSYCD